MEAILNQREMEYIMEHAKKNPVTLQRYDEIVSIVQGDDVAEHLLELLILKSSEYVKTVCRNDALISTQGKRLDGEEFREFMTERDRQRKISHDALISSLFTFNRYILEKYEGCPTGGIFSLDPLAIHNRVAVGDWAGQLIYELFVRRAK